MPEEVSNNPINRRSFLKLGGAVLAAFGGLKYVSRDGDKPMEGESKWRVVEGEDGGHYIPIYEVHENPVSAKKFVDMPKTGAVFYESGRPSSEMLKMDAETLVGKAPERWPRDYYVPLDHLKYWEEKDTYIAFEGIDYPNSIGLEYVFGHLVEGLGGLALLAKTYVDRSPEPLTVAQKEVLSGEMKQTLMKLGGIWGSTNILQLGVNIYLRSLLESGVGIGNTSLKIQRLGQLVSQVHPEFDVVFLRNLIMARRLQALSKHLSQVSGDGRNANEPEAIAFNVGAAHSGIEDWLILGPEVTKFMIKLMPYGLWKELEDINGGAESIATMPLVHAEKGNLEVVKFKDEWFQQAIEEKAG